MSDDDNQSPAPNGGLGGLTVGQIPQVLVQLLLLLFQAKNPPGTGDQGDHGTRWEFVPWYRTSIGRVLIVVDMVVMVGGSVLIMAVQLERLPTTAVWLLVILTAVWGATVYLFIRILADIKLTTITVIRNSLRVPLGFAIGVALVLLFKVDITIPDAIKIGIGFVSTFYIEDIVNGGQYLLNNGVSHIQDRQ